MDPSEFVAEAVQKTVVHPAWKDALWMRGFGALADLHEEKKRIQHLIEEEFGLRPDRKPWPDDRGRTVRPGRGLSKR